MLTENEIFTYMRIRNSHLLATDFRFEIRVSHSDGSKFTVSSGYYERIGRHLMVFWEHGAPMHFHLDDVKWSRKDKF